MTHSPPIPSSRPSFAHQHSGCLEMGFRGGCGRACPPTKCSDSSDGLYTVRVSAIPGCSDSPLSYIFSGHGIQEPALLYLEK